LRSRWDRPEDIEDRSFVAEVEVAVDSSGQIDNPLWKKSSGNKRWDDSVRRALANAKRMDHPPPPHFPARVVVRFDVVETEAIAAQ
jgi:TonB family protein